LSIWARLPTPVSSALAVQAAAEGLRLAAGPRFGVNGAFERRLRLPYTLPEAELNAAVDILARAVRKVERTPAGRVAPRRLEAVY
jgi:DNA-binding transcriptional MocR family regulator